jgi:hypothetical protein
VGAEMYQDEQDEAKSRLSQFYESAYIQTCPTSKRITEMKNVLCGADIHTLFYKILGIVKMAIGLYQS